MIEVLTRQRVFPDILLPFLRRVDYDKVTEMARRWCIADLVVIDPAICLGKTHHRWRGDCTLGPRGCYKANDHDAERVADWFKVHAKHVVAAVDFEKKFGGFGVIFRSNMPPQLAAMVDILERNLARSYYDDDRFTDMTPDVEWIKRLAADDPPWIIISGDGRILRNKTELSALKEAKLTFFA